MRGEEVAVFRAVTHEMNRKLHTGNTDDILSRITTRGRVSLSSVCLVCSVGSLMVGRSVAFVFTEMQNDEAAIAERLVRVLEDGVELDAHAFVQFESFMRQYETKSAADHPA